MKKVPFGIIYTAQQFLHLSVLQISLSACSIELSSALNSNSLAKFTWQQKDQNSRGEKNHILATKRSVSRLQYFSTYISHLFNVRLAGHVMGADELYKLLV